MQSYTVNYRKLGTDKWCSLDGIIADGVCPGFPHRFFINEVGKRYEIPVTDVEFEFGKERSEMMAEQERQKAEAAAQAEMAKKMRVKTRR